MTPPSESAEAPFVGGGPEGLLLVVAEQREGVGARLRTELAWRLRTDERAVTLVGPAGRPPYACVGGAVADWGVSFSDTRGLALGAAMTEARVGVDVELIDPDFDWVPVAREFFSGSVAGWLSRSPEEARREFYRAWVRWEAALKCLGTGFGRGHPPAGNVPAEMVVADLHVGSGYAAAAAVWRRNRGQLAAGVAGSSHFRSSPAASENSRPELGFIR